MPLIGVGHGAVGTEIEGADGDGAALGGGDAGAVEEILLLLVQNAARQHEVAAAQQAHALGPGLHGGVDVLGAEAVGQQLKIGPIPGAVGQGPEGGHLRPFPLELADAGDRLLSGQRVGVEGAGAVGGVQNDGQ